MKEIIKLESVTSINDKKRDRNSKTLNLRFTKVRDAENIFVPSSINKSHGVQ